MLLRYIMDERETLTRNIIFQKLLREAKRSMVGSVLFFVFGSLVLGMMYFMFVPRSKAFAMFQAVSFVILAALCLVFFVRGALRMGKANRGEFSVEKDILIDVKDNQLNVWRLLITGRIFSRSNYDHIFHFESGKTFVANSDEYQSTSLDATARFSLSGDPFFLVFYNDSPEKIVLLYSSKLYNYKE